MKEREAETPVGFVRQAGRKEETVTITTLQEFDPEQVDMFTVVLIGNSQSYYREGKLITPRGYYREKTSDATGIGQEIMINSFRTIEKELKIKYSFGSQMGVTACHPYHSRFRDGKHIACRSFCRRMSV